MTGRYSTDRVAHGLSGVCQSGGNTLATPRSAMSEVQICGIPKLSALEVAPTP